MGARSASAGIDGGPAEVWSALAASKVMNEAVNGALTSWIRVQSVARRKCGRVVFSIETASSTPRSQTGCDGVRPSEPCGISNGAVVAAMYDVSFRFLAWTGMQH